MATLSDFSGAFVVLAPSATAANNAAGRVVTVQSNRYLSMGSPSVGGTTNQNDPIVVVPLFGINNKILRLADKTAGEAWTAGQKIYLVAATNVATTTAASNVLIGVAAANAASADVFGDVILGNPV